MSDWREILRSAHNEPIDPAHYTAVRARVMAEIGRRRTPWRRLAWISGAIGVITAAVALVPMPDLRQVPPPPRLAIAIPSAPAAPLARPKLEPANHIQRARQPRREPLTIKLQTNDPNIVIYWIAD
jgi:hypothetical protein